MYIGMNLEGSDSRWLSGERGAQLHLTLVHLGYDQIRYQQRSRAMALADRLHDLSSGLRPITIVLADLEPWKKNDETLLVRQVYPNKDLYTLRSHVITILNSLHLEWDNRQPWLPHVTCGTPDATVRQDQGSPEIILNNITLIGSPVIQSYVFQFR